MQVVELQQQAHLLAGSSQAEVNATMSGQQKQKKNNENKDFESLEKGRL